MRITGHSYAVIMQRLKMSQEMGSRAAVGVKERVKNQSSDKPFGLKDLEGPY